MLKLERLTRLWKTTPKEQWVEEPQIPPAEFYEDPQLNIVRFVTTASPGLSSKSQQFNALIWHNQLWVFDKGWWEKIALPDDQLSLTALFRFGPEPEEQFNEQLYQLDGDHGQTVTFNGYQSARLLVGAHGQLTLYEVHETDQVLVHIEFPESTYIEAYESIERLRELRHDLAVYNHLLKVYDYHNPDHTPRPVSGVTHLVESTLRKIESEHFTNVEQVSSSLGGIRV